MGDRGLTFELSPQLAHELRNTRKSYEHPSIHRGSAAEASKEDHVEPSLEHNKMMMISLPNKTTTKLPTSLPLVLVNVERLVGYIPTTEHEAQDLKRQVQSALMADCNALPEEDEDDEDPLATFFEERTKEMFESGLAQHSDTSSQCNVTTSSLLESFKVIAIDYPLYLCQTDSDPPTVVKTSLVWERLLQEYNENPLLDRIMTHLRNCSRPLLWKDAMRSQLLQLVKEEERQRVVREQEGELHEWRTVRRKEQLEKLYSVRETLQHQLEVSSFHLKALEHDRDEQVAIYMRQNQLDGLESFDFTSTVFSFPNKNELMLGLQGESDDEDYDDDEPQLESDFNESAHSFESEIEEGDASVPESSDEEGEHDEVSRKVETDGETSVTSLSASAKDRKRSKSAGSKRRQRAQETINETKHKAKLEAAKMEEERVRELCTTPELKSALAIQTSLENRLKQVDDLLESLQEEEWIEEEEEPAESLHESDDSGTVPSNYDNNEVRWSMLDQILAMILGATPPPFQNVGRAREEHTAWLEKEHLSIRTSWKQLYGRLPPAIQPLDSANTGDAQPNTVSSNTDFIAMAETSQGDNRDPAELAIQQRKLRESLGIQNNETSDWDEESDDDVKIPTKTGLRPGGRLP